MSQEPIATEPPAPHAGASASSSNGQPNGRQDTPVDPGDLTELLQELRVLIPGVQVLTGFLVIVPFSQGFSHIPDGERWVYLAAFVCALVSLVLFMAPAAQHRLERPLVNRVRFKQYATWMTIAGLVPLSLALILTAHLVVSQTAGYSAALVVALVAAALISAVWWLWPLEARRQAQHPLRERRE
jgi:hypothetical protein